MQGVLLDACIFSGQVRIIADQTLPFVLLQSSKTARESLQAGNYAGKYLILGALLRKDQQKSM
jgi:hypothetical protein